MLCLTIDHKDTPIKMLSFYLALFCLLQVTKGARNPNLNVAFTNACAAVV